MNILAIVNYLLSDMFSNWKSMSASSTTFNHRRCRPLNVQVCKNDEDDCAILCIGRKLFDQHENVTIL